MLLVHLLMMLRLRTAELMMTRAGVPHSILLMLVVLELRIHMSIGGRIVILGLAGGASLLSRQTSVA